MNARRLFLAGVITAAAAATAANPAAAQSTPPAEAHAAREAEAEPKTKTKSRRGRGDITLQDLQAASFTDAHSVITRLRPNWLKVRGAGSMRQPEYVKIYQDGILLGGPGALRQIAAESIQRISHLDGLSATQRFGTDHGNGAILVETRR